MQNPEKSLIAPLKRAVEETTTVESPLGSEVAGTKDDTE